MISQSPRIPDKLRIIGSVNTQTRRLGYILQLCMLIGDKYISATRLSRELEKWATQNSQALDLHISNKGTFGRSPQSWSKKYITLASQLQLISEVSGYLRLSKTGRVLLNLERKEISEGNPFKLSPRIALFFLYQILTVDSDYLIPILELSTTYHKQSKIMSESQDFLKKRFKSLSQQIASIQLRSKFEERASSISSWENPRKYAEHVVLPRLNWLLDLELLDWESHKSDRLYIPSKKGTNLLGKLFGIEEYHFVTEEWCQSNLFLCWPLICQVEAELWVDLSEQQKSQIIHDHVKSGFDLFKTMAYPRVSAYQIVLYTIFSLYFKKKIATQFSDIKKSLEFYSDSGKNWKFKWLSIDNDGYLILPTKSP